jgi:HTH-type transcriptional regulator/antitoxin HigA
MIATPRSARGRQFSAIKYKRLLGETMPRPIRDDKELERIQGVVDRLTNKLEDELPAEESELLDLLSLLIERYEDVHHPIPAAPPHAVVKMLMEDRGVKQADLVPIFGSRGAVSRALSGATGITKTQAKRLAAYFGMAAELFI